MQISKIYRQNIQQYILQREPLRGTYRGPVGHGIA